MQIVHRDAQFIERSVLAGELGAKQLVKRRRGVGIAALGKRAVDGEQPEQFGKGFHVAGLVASA